MRYHLIRHAFFYKSIELIKINGKFNLGETLIKIIPLEKHRRRATRQVLHENHNYLYIFKFYHVLIMI